MTLLTKRGRWHYKKSGRGKERGRRTTITKEMRQTNNNMLNIGELLLEFPHFSKITVKV